MQKSIKAIIRALGFLLLCCAAEGVCCGQTKPVPASLDRPASAGSVELAAMDATGGRSSGGATADANSSTPLPAAYTPSLAAMPIEPVTKPKPPGVAWGGLAKDSLTFLTVMQGFRIGTEHGTRAAFGVNSFFKGYVHAVQNLHGFADGDEFYVNYVGHPMQGAVSGYIWANNDRAYKDVYFGKSHDYWKEKLRGGAFSYVYSVQFEVGPVSEASIGDMQKYYPAQGFVDHVVTPAVGMGWAIGEDAIDHYLVRYIEQHTDKRYIKLFARGILNPARSFANAMSMKYPWDRSNRPAISASNSADYFKPVLVNQPVNPPPGVAPFEFHAVSVIKTYVGSNSMGSCAGGGAGIGIRIAENWQIVTDVNGCKMTNLPVNTSGDSLTYVVGPKWSSQVSRHWVTHAKFQVGGTKLFQEIIDPAKKKAADERTKALAKAGKDTWPPPYDEFAKSWDNNAFALVTGAGVDWKFNNALSFRTSLDYSRTWNRDINNINYRSGVQLTSGLILDMGTW